MVKPWVTAKLDWELIKNNPFIKKGCSIGYILYQLDGVIQVGWTHKDKICELDKICDFITVDENTALNLTEQKYNELVEELKYKIKKRKIEMKLEEIKKDFE